MNKLKNMNFIKIKILLLFIIVIGCNTNAQYAGKYVIDDKKDVVNYLIINTDGTYLHYYKYASMELSQKGEWKIGDAAYNSINLYDFCNYNEDGLSFKKFDIYFLVKDGDYLNPGYDGMVRGSFRKEKE